MPVISQDNEFILEDLELENFWRSRPFHLEVTRNTPILSFAQKIEAVDPLAVLDGLAGEAGLRFYWENPSKQEAVAAWGVTRDLLVNSPGRFEQTQLFVDSCFDQVQQEGDIGSTGSETRVFCSFSFFEDSAYSERNGGGTQPTATMFLPRFQITKKNKNHFLVINYPLSDHAQTPEVVRSLRDKVSSIDWSEYKELAPSHKKTIDWQEKDIFSAASSQYFKTTVRSALNSIALDEMSKIVLAHAVDIKSPTPFDTINSLQNLRDRHPDCYIFDLRNNNGQDFIGASPERLVSIQNRQLVTDALAGSAPRGKSTSEDVQWANILLKNRKEKREHQAVSDFITARLKNIGLKPQQLPLQLLQLSNIQHLWTPIYAHLPKGIEPLEIIAQLHPTPAVAGVPNRIACNKIRHYEKFDRGLYAAPLGWIDNHGNCEFVVGIRSALIEQNNARLYAGAGIVSGSNPDKEFVEIQLKLQSLLKALV